MSTMSGAPIVHKSSESSPETQPPHHASYDRIHAEWLCSRDQGSFTLRDFVSSPLEPLHINCERLVEILGDAQHDHTEFGAWVFRQGAAILAEIEPDASYIDNNDFSHTAKYLFVGTCFSSAARSVLDDLEGREDAVRLINRAVTFCERSKSLGTMPLLIKGIIASNIRGWVESGEVQSFVCKPASLNSRGLRSLMRHASELEAHKRGALSSKATHGPFAVVERFCAASSPVEFLLWALCHKVALPVPEKTHVLKRALLTTLGEAAKRYPFLVEGGAQDSNPQEKHDRLPAVELRQGVYFDVFGTLIHHDGSPNFRVAQVVTELMRQVPPRPVFLVSDSQDEEIAKALSFLEELPPVVHKDRLERFELEFLIDNCEPGPQGLRARHYFSPDQVSEFVATLKENGSGWTTL